MKLLGIGVRGIIDMFGRFSWTSELRNSLKLFFGVSFAGLHRQYSVLGATSCSRRAERDVQS